MRRPEQPLAAICATSLANRWLAAGTRRRMICASRSNPGCLTQWYRHRRLRVSCRSRVRFQSFVALEANQIGVKPRRQGSHLGLADPCVALQQQRPLHRKRQEHHRRQVEVRQIVLVSVDAATPTEGIDSGPARI